MPVDAVDFLNANDQNEVRLPVVKYLASQRASSIQTLVTYLMVVRLVLINRISLHQSPTGGLRPRIKCGAVKLTSDRGAVQTGIRLLLLLNRKPSSCEPLSCCLVLCGLGVRVSPHRALGAPSPRCT
jgi:hypothetical protein